MCGTIDHGSCIRWVLDFDIKTGYDNPILLILEGIVVEKYKIWPRKPGLRETRKESKFWVTTKFDFRINSWRDLVQESRATVNRCIYLHFNHLGGTQSELFSTRSWPISTQLVILDKAQHSATSPEDEDLTNQDKSSLAKHLGTIDEVWYHVYQVFWTWKRGTGVYPQSSHSAQGSGAGGP
jgi:hypothetical protein